MGTHISHWKTQLISLSRTHESREILQPPHISQPSMTSWPRKMTKPHIISIGNRQDISHTTSASQGGGEMADASIVTYAMDGTRRRITARKDFQKPRIKQRGRTCFFVNGFGQIGCRHKYNYWWRQPNVHRRTVYHLSILKILRNVQPTPSR